MAKHIGLIGGIGSVALARYLGRALSEAEGSMRREWESTGRFFR